jgi:CBS domain-containing protein
MMVKEVMRSVDPVLADGTLAEAVAAIEASGCEAVPIVGNGYDGPEVRQLVTVRDLPKLRRIEQSADRGHAIGRTVLDLLCAIGRRPDRFPTIAPEASIADAWGVMCESCITHLPVVAGGHVLGMVSLVVSWNEFPHRSPTAALWP